jgi:hypothetical protein
MSKGPCLSRTVIVTADMTPAVESVSACPVIGELIKCLRAGCTVSLNGEDSTPLAPNTTLTSYVPDLVAVYKTR